MNTETPSDTARLLGEATDFLGLHRVLRERADELQISRLVIDEVAGLSSGYAGKLLSSPPTKHLGPATLPAVLGALGAKLLIVEDRTALARLATCPRRQRMHARAKVSNAEPPRIKVALPDVAREYFGALGRLGAKALHASRSDKQRSEAGRNAARACWRRGKKEPSR